MTAGLFEALPIDAPASQLGESPFWHPDESALYWCDIPGKRLNRFHPASGAYAFWAFECEPACCAPLLGGDLILGMRDGLWRFCPETGERHLLASAPYDPAFERFNDGKADPQGRFWVGTIYEPRDPALAHLYCWDGSHLNQVAGGVTVSNGLAWSPDGGTLYWSDTKTHRIRAFAVDGRHEQLSHEREFAAFPLKQAGQDLSTYGGRPDGAAVGMKNGSHRAYHFER